MYVCMYVCAYTILHDRLDTPILAKLARSHLKLKDTNRVVMKLLDIIRMSPGNLEST